MMKPKMFKWTVRIAYTLVTVLALAACSEVSQAPNPVTSTPETMNASLETLARLFAKAATDSSVRQHIQQEVAKRFDGDANALYRTLAAPSQLQAQGVGVDIRQALANAYTSREGLSSQTGGALEAVDRLTDSIPRLQVAVPELFDTWDAKSYTPLVGYVPAGIDDMALEEIKAFDSQGNVHMLDAQTPPTQPVIILSQNERTDDAGQLLKSETSGTSDDTLTSQAASYEVEIGWIELHNDHEPWIKGDPEVYLLAQALVNNPVFSTRASFNEGSDDVNEENARYVVERDLGNSRNAVGFYWYESDGGSIPIKVTVRGVTFELEIKDDDDELGSTGVSHASLEGNTSDSRNLGAIEFSWY